MAWAENLTVKISKMFTHYVYVHTNILPIINLEEN